MNMMKLPAFGETEFFEHRENRQARVIMIPHADASAFDRYCAYVEKQGGEPREAWEQDAHHYAAYSLGADGLFLNYYETTEELYLVEESDTPYFSYGDPTLPEITSPTVTQITLEDFGMSYVIRLPDGRFIVIDGGDEFAPDQDRLMQCLTEGAEGRKPVIAAWILSHPHNDHFHCFIGFMNRYADAVVIEKFLLNFPEADDLTHYPALEKKDPRFVDNSGVTNIPLMWERIGWTGAPVYLPHTGQRYRIGAAACEILSSMDDTIHCSTNINSASLVIRMELAGQVLLWTTDASFSYAKLPEKHGERLRADILQVPHHGFQCGKAEAEIAGYQYIRPKVCLLPVSDYNAYTMIDTYKPSSRYLMTRADVAEMIAGTEQRTLTLPYTPPSYARAEMEKKYLSGLDNSGSCTWVFTDLLTDREEDFRFTLLNMTCASAEVWIELFFEDQSKQIRFIRAEVKAQRLRSINIVGEDVEDDALYFNWLSLKAQGVPEHAAFAVRFMSNVPIVVSHKNHKPAYHSVNR